MKRSALLIGNTGGLEGVSVDIERTTAFLMSNLGGQWRSSEITSLLNPSKFEAERAIARIRAERPDYCFFLFSGHGSHYGQTHLNLNSRGEKLLESELNSIASRQLSIFDCCRVQPAQVRKALEAHAFSALDSVDMTRQRYERRIMAAVPQHAKLYACAVGEFSYDYPEGAAYLSNLIQSAKMDRNSEWRTVEEAHSLARTLTIEHAAKQGHKQTPQAVLPKVLPEMQLILSIA